MATHDVNFGPGLATGMFYHAPKGTALPTYPSETLAADWVEVGDISEDGITWTPFGDIQQLKNWAKVTKRAYANERGSISAPIISTTEESLKTVFGSVTHTAANAQHGVLIPEGRRRKGTTCAGEKKGALGECHEKITNFAVVYLRPI